LCKVVTLMFCVKISRVWPIYMIIFSLTALHSVRHHSMKFSRLVVIAFVKQGFWSWSSFFFFYIHLEAQKGTTFLLWICSVIWQNLVLLLLMNIVVDVTYLIAGIYTNFCTFLCKKCDVGYYFINHGVYRRRLCCNIISASK